MLIPSIDLQGGETVQLVGGQERALGAGDPRPIAERFRLAGEVAVIDLDAAMGTGSNAALIEGLLRTCRARVGGGIRSVEAARRWLDLGAAKVILGTRAEPALLSELPKERVIAAVDAVHGEVVVEGWKTRTGASIEARLAELKPYVSGFLITFVEREGRMVGVDLDRVRALVAAAAPARVTIAGGVTTAEDVAAIDALGADAQVGMALYTGRLTLDAAIAAPLRRTPLGVWPTAIVDPLDRVLALGWSSPSSLHAAIEAQRAALMTMPEAKPAPPPVPGGALDAARLLAVELDADRASIRLRVEAPALDADAFGPTRGLRALEATLAARRAALVGETGASAPAGSYTRRLFEDPDLLAAKLREEAAELAEATSDAHAAEEASDVAYFTLVALARRGLDLRAVDAILDARARRVTRRAGNKKPDPKETP
jgi:phosphoribosyl-ATP pyrophosphohydrolase/phosphoribosyl-AMP cyclohydrolase